MDAMFNEVYMEEPPRALKDALEAEPQLSLDELRASIKSLEAEYSGRRESKNEAPLSGRIIHVSHYIPFVLRPAAPPHHHQHRPPAGEQHPNGYARPDSVGGGPDPNCLVDPSEGYDGSQDMEQKLKENLVRAQATNGRSTFDAADNPLLSADPRRRTPTTTSSSLSSSPPPPPPPKNNGLPSAAVQFFATTSSHHDRASDSRESTLSDVAAAKVKKPSPLAAAAVIGAERRAGRRWTLTPRRGHTALNSGIRSLCSTHRQTFVGWAGDVQFGPDDERTDSSELTAEEKEELEETLARLEDVDDDEAGGEGTRTSPSEDSPIGRDGGAGIKYAPVWLDYMSAHGHYEGYCKTTLWPLFHYLLWQDVPDDRRQWDEYSWESYVKVNEAFAETIARTYKPGDMVWVHDYHLLLVPKMLRAIVPDAIVGLFLHAPFPSSEIFRCLPKRKEILEGMLGADLACFQTFSYSRHFLSSCVRVLGLESTPNGIDGPNGQLTNIAYRPIGVDYERIARDRSSPGVMPKVAAIRELYKGKKIIVGRDKLDVVKGVMQKLQAFQKFLHDYPEWRNNVVLIQVTAPSLNDSAKLEREVSEMVSHINGEFGSLSFTPVHHYHQIIERDEYFALLSVADLALITSVRDGMNTTSMEYVICQERSNKSPLILSEFTGTAGPMKAALQVNPWNVDGVARAIDQGLCMSDEERELRHAQLFHHVSTRTSHEWAASLVHELLKNLIVEHAAHFTPKLECGVMLDGFKTSRKRLFLLDYDGTLTPIVKNPAAAVPSSELIASLQKLTGDPQNVVYIISGRDGEFLDRQLGHIPGLGFSAEHGSFVRRPGQKAWRNLTKELDMSWMKDVTNIFKYYTERTTGSWIETKKSSITWHYRASDPDFGSFQAKECQAHMETLTTQNRLPIEVLVGKKNLEVRPLAVNKGEICKRIMYENPDSDFVFCAGDDKTDEDMFRALCHLAPATPSADSSPLSNTAPLMLSPPAPMSDSQETLRSVASSPIPISLRPESIFSTTVGPRDKKTLAKWHLDSPADIIDALGEMAATLSG